MKNCPECNSENIINHARLSSGGQTWLVAVDEEPYAAFFKKTTSSDIRIKVCGNCGLIKFYAIYPDNLWTAYQNQQKNL
jgi:hypothetical protein